VLVTLLILAGAGYLLVPSISGGGSVKAKRMLCLAHLKQIGEALDAYLQSHDQTWPYVAKLKTFEVHTPPWPTLPVVLSPFTGGNPDVFSCPADRRDLAADSPLARQFPVRTTWFATEGSSYEWMWGEAYGGKEVGKEERSKAGILGGLERADQPLLADFEAFHAGDEGGSFNTLYADLKARTARSRARK
jgi:hypothetical protein